MLKSGMTKTIFSDYPRIPRRTSIHRVRMSSEGRTIEGVLFKDFYEKLYENLFKISQLWGDDDDGESLTTCSWTDPFRGK